MPDRSRPLPFQPFYVAHRAAVLRLLVGMVGPDDAQDCFQDTWLKALDAWPPADPGGRLDSWVLTIAHRTAIDVIRRSPREQAVARVPEVAIEDLPVLEPDPLWSVVAALPERQRVVVLLRVVLDRTHAQVAEVVGCSEDAARRAYSDAIAALRRHEEVPG